MSRGAQSLGGFNPMTAANADAAGPQDLMSKVMEILRKAGLDGKSGSTNILSLDDMQRLLKALQRMGPQAIKQVLHQNPGFTSMLSKAMQ